jgi:hypothetical protein
VGEQREREIYLGESQIKWLSLSLSNGIWLTVLIFPMYYTVSDNPSLYLLRYLYKIIPQMQEKSIKCSHYIYSYLMNLSQSFLP